MRNESWDTTKMHQLSVYIRTAEGGNSAVHVYYVVLAGLLVVILYVKLYLLL